MTPMVARGDRVLAPYVHVDYERHPRRSQDRRLTSEVGKQLRRSGYPALRDIQVRTVDGEVRLRGRVPTYYLKQLAQVVAMSVNGVERLHNEIDVV